MSATLFLDNSGQLHYLSWIIHAVSTKTFKALDKDLQCSSHYDCWNSVLGAINRSAVKKEVPWSNNWEMLPMTNPFAKSDHAYSHGKGSGQPAAKKSTFLSLTPFPKCIPALSAC